MCVCVEREREREREREIKRALTRQKMRRRPTRDRLPMQWRPSCRGAMRAAVARRRPERNEPKSNSSHSAVKRSTGQGGCQRRVECLVVWLYKIVLYFEAFVHDESGANIRATLRTQLSKDQQVTHTPTGNNTPKAVQRSTGHTHTDREQHPRSCIQINRSHTQTEREQHPRYRHTHTTRTTPQTPKRTPPTNT